MAKGLIGKLKDWLIESEDEDEKEAEIKAAIKETLEKQEIVKTQAKPQVKAEVKPVESVKSEPKKTEPKKEEAVKAEPAKPQPKVEAKVEKKVEATEEKTSKTFLKVSNPDAEARRAEHKAAREAYRPAQVISPIFGSSQAEAYNIGSSQLEYDDEKSTTSVIGTVFSPMYGKDIVKVTVEDEVDEKVANMTTKDFLSKPTEQKEVEPPVITKITDKVISASTKSSKSEKVSDDTDNYENLSLFD